MDYNLSTLIFWLHDTFLCTIGSLYPGPLVTTCQQQPPPHAHRCHSQKCILTLPRVSQGKQSYTSSLENHWVRRPLPQLPERLGLSFQKLKRTRVDPRQEYVFLRGKSELVRQLCSAKSSNTWLLRSCCPAVCRMFLLSEPNWTVTAPTFQSAGWKEEDRDYKLPL